MHELYVLQSKKVKLVATKSGPFSTLTESFEVKCDSPLGMRGSRSFLEEGLSYYRFMINTKLGSKYTGMMLSI